MHLPRILVVVVLLLLLFTKSAAAGDEPSMLEASIATRHAIGPWKRTSSGVPRDVLENRTWAMLGAGRRENDDLTWKLGIRFDTEYSAKAARVGPFAAPALSFEMRPWESWVDFALGKTLRVRAGNQIFVRGKLDVASPSALIGAIDLRQGPAAEFDQLRLPLPLLSTTWTPHETFQVELAYAPFFVPHRFDVFGSNYALLAATTSPGLYRGLQALEQQLSRQTLDALGEDLARLNANEHDLSGGEAMAHVLWRAGPVDLGATYGFVRQKLPAISLSPELQRFLENPTDPAARDGLSNTNAATRVIADYDRYHQVALDTEAAVGAYTIAFEAGLAFDRKQYIASATPELEAQNITPESVSTPLAQGGLKWTWVPSESFVATAEVSAMVPTARPMFANGNRARWLGYGDLPALGIVALGGEWRTDENRIALHLVGTSSGPSLGAVARYGHHITTTIELGAGVAGFLSGSSDPRTIGGMTDRFDQAFVFAEWKP